MLEHDPKLTTAQLMQCKYPVMALQPEGNTRNMASSRILHANGSDAN